LYSGNSNETTLELEYESDYNMSLKKLSTMPLEPREVRIKEFVEKYILKLRPIYRDNCFEFLVNKISKRI